MRFLPFPDLQSSGEGQLLNTCPVPGLGLHVHQISFSESMDRLCPLGPMLATLLCPVCPPGIQQASLAETLGTDDVA